MTNGLAEAVSISPSTALRTAEVAEQLGIDRSASRLVQIDAGQLESMAHHIRSSAGFHSFSRAPWDDDLFWNVTGTAEARSQFFAVGNAVNFRFWRLENGNVIPATGRIGDRSYRGAMYMWRSLRRSLEHGIPILDPHFLSRLSGRDFDALFTDDDGVNPLTVGRSERVANLRDLGARLAADWDGIFLNVARASAGSLVEFTRLAGMFRAFDDPLFKLTMVNAIMHGGSGVYEFQDEPMPAIDYHLVRHALRQGLLRPHATLARKLATGALLIPHEAYELRRLALVVFVELSEQAAISGEVLDNKYWLNRVNCTDTVPVCQQEGEAHACPFLGACPQLVRLGIPLELTRYY